ncbi:hypothetical protein Lal_00043265, partial [Lupinus albus]
ESVCVTYGTIEKLFANGWYYDGCPQCNRKADAIRIPFNCPRCGKFLKEVVSSDGKLSELNDGFALIEIPEQCLITNYNNLIHAIVKSTHPNLVDEYMNEEFLQCRHSIIFFNIFINVMKGVTPQILIFKIIPRLIERFSHERERITWEGEILDYTGGFSPKRELSRLCEKWQFWAVDTV